MPEPPDIFQPHMPGVELLSDIDAYFAAARRLSATGEYTLEDDELRAQLAAMPLSHTGPTPTRSSTSSSSRPGWAFSRGLE